MGILNNGMSIVGVSIDWQQVVKGLVLLRGGGLRCLRSDVLHGSAACVAWHWLRRVEAGVPPPANGGVTVRCCRPVRPGAVHSIGVGQVRRMSSWDLTA